MSATVTFLRKLADTLDHDSYGTIECHCQGDFQAACRAIRDVHQPTPPTETDERLFTYPPGIQES